MVAAAVAAMEIAYLQINRMRVEHVQVADVELDVVCTNITFELGQICRFEHILHCCHLLRIGSLLSFG